MASIDLSSPQSVHAGLIPERPRGIASVTTERLVALSWEVADVIDASVRAGEPETSWRRFARGLEAALRAELRSRTP